MKKKYLAYIDVADDESDEFFEDIRYNLRTLDFVLNTFLMTALPGKQSGITIASSGKPMLCSYDMRAYSRINTVCPCEPFGSSRVYWGKTS